MIDKKRLRAAIKAHPPTSLYRTCQCGAEINSMDGWLDHILEVEETK